MYEVKVKTLDGRTQEFSVPDNATVLEFKNIVHERTEIPVERQRLLYQGKALVDDRILNSYEVAGNVMHLVTRLPPQQPTTEDTLTDSDDNSNFSRDNIRNIISDVFGNIGDLNNPMGVSVNNEGSRMDITVNIPTQNRLSLSRLRQNYVMRLLHQARNVINHMEDPSSVEPRSDRERMRQDDPYDIGTNDELLTEVTSQPLPISSLADMIGMTRALWTSAEPQLANWESVLRRENESDVTPRTDLEMQRIHDSASRYVHLFSHVLHILSDYLVEFQPSAITRATAARTNASNADIATASVDNVMDHDFPQTNAMPASTVTEVDDRSRYLYVFSEMPAQLVQVRLDVDSTIHDLRPSAPTSESMLTSQTATNSTMPPPLNNAFSSRATATTGSSATTPAITPASTPVITPTTTPVTIPGNRTSTPDPRARSRRRFQAGSNMADSLLRTTLQNAMLGSGATRPQMPSSTGASNLLSGTRALRAGSQFSDNIDPYLRCQSRHFQNPANLRSGAVISTFSGIRLRDNSRPSRPSRAPATTTTTTPVTTTTTTDPHGHETDPMQSILNSFMNSVFSNNSSEIIPLDDLRIPVRRNPSMQSFFDHRASGTDFNTPLSQLFPEILTNVDMDHDNFITNQIIQIVTSQLTLMDFLGVVRGQYSALNRLRIPLQEILSNHQLQVGSRDALIDRVVSDMEYFNRAYISVFERLRNGTPVPNLSEEARNSFNIRLDVFRTMNNLNRHHFNSLVDMIMRSPTNQGFGQLLMNSLTSHHAESLALIDIICNNNDELRQFLIKSLYESIISTMNQSTNVDLSHNALSFDVLFGDINGGLFRRPEQLSELTAHTLNNFAVYLNDTDTETAANNVDITNNDSIENMVTNLSENITNGTIVTEIERPLTDLESSELTAGESMVDDRGAGWQSVMPEQWLQVMSRDTASDPTGVLVHHSNGSGHPVPYSDAYVAGMPAKRRKVIVSQRSVRPPAEMMHECLDQAILSVGFQDPAAMATATGLTEAFQEMVTERVGQRLSGATEDGILNFVPDRFPSAEHNFINRKKRSGDGNGDKKNN